MPLIENPSNLDRAMDLVNSSRPMKDEDTEIRALLTKEGATLQSAACNLADLAQNSANPSTRLKATETILKLQGVSLRDDEVAGVNVTFVVHGDQIKMQNILIPKR